MTKLHLLIAFIGLCLCSQAQDQRTDKYHVTIVKGNVLKKDRKKVTPGSTLTADDIVLFTSTKDLLILLHPSKGRFIVSPGSTVTSRSEIEMLIRGSLHYFVKDVRLSSRSLDEEAGISDHFVTNTAINNRILIIEKLRIPLKHTRYRKLDQEDNFFFLQVDDEVARNRKLEIINDTLVIEKDDIFLKQADSVELILGFIKNYSTEKKVEKIASFVPSFLSREAALEILNAVSQSMQGKSKIEVLAEMYTQLYYLYGKPRMSDLELLFSVK